MATSFSLKNKKPNQYGSQALYLAAYVGEKIKAGVFLDYLYTLRSAASLQGGQIFKTFLEFEQDTGLTHNEVNLIKHRLEKKGFIRAEKKAVNLPGWKDKRQRWHFTVFWEKFKQLSHPYKKYQGASFYDVLQKNISKAKAKGVNVAPLGREDLDRESLSKKINIKESKLTPKVIIESYPKLIQKMACHWTPKQFPQQGKLKVASTIKKHFLKIKAGEEEGEISMNSLVTHITEQFSYLEKLCEVNNYYHSTTLESFFSKLFERDFQKLLAGTNNNNPQSQATPPKTGVRSYHQLLFEMQQQLQKLCNSGSSTTPEEINQILREATKLIEDSKKKYPADLAQNKARAAISKLIKSLQATRQSLLSSKNELDFTKITPQNRGEEPSKVPDLVEQIKQICLVIQKHSSIKEEHKTHCIEILSSYNSNLTPANEENYYAEIHKIKKELNRHLGNQIISKIFEVVGIYSSHKKKE